MVDNVICKLQFDAGKFISEIKKRPCIWNKMSSEDNPKARDQQWSEIVELYSAENTSPAKKKRICQHLKLKWRNIRDCFVKAHKARHCPDQVSEATRKKERYSFYNDLLFLAEAKSIEMTPDDLLIHNDQGPVDDNNDDEDDDDGFAWPPQLSNDPTALIPDIKIEYGDIPLAYEIEDPLDESNTTLSTKKRKHTESENEDRDQRNKTKKKKIDLQLSGNIVEDDDSVLFFISLVKEFKKVPEAKQLQTKLNIMKLIQESQDPL